MINREEGQFALIAKETKDSLSGGIDAFFEQARQGCHDLKSFVSMDKLEEIYLDMMTRSQISYIDMIERTLSAIDETKMLELKKESSRIRESY